jgi:acyl carrier protein
LSDNMTAIVTILTGLLTEQTREERTVTPETDLISDLALESVQIMEFMVDVEDHYDIAISLEALAEVRTLGQLAELVADMLEDR